jgi:hypothetical protein
MSQRFLALRMLGNFVWPPMSDTRPTGLVEGAIEVIYVREPSGSRYFACGRWTPKSDFPQGDSPKTLLWRSSTEPYPQQTMYEVPLNDLVGNGSESFLFRCAVTDTSKRGVKLRFQGGRLFEQFKVPQFPASDPSEAFADLKLDLRLPLARHVTTGSGQELILSAIDFGQPQNTGFRLRLGLPLALPFPQQGAQGGQAGAVAFTAVRSKTDLIVANPANFAGEAMPFSAVFLGPLGRTRPTIPAGDHVVGKTVFARDASPPSPYLKLRPPAASATAEEKKEAERIEKQTWLLNDGVRVVLDRLGLKASRRTVAALQADETGDTFLLPTSAGVWGEESVGDAPPPFRLLRRLRLHAPDAPSPRPDPDDDIRIVRGNIQLRRRKGHDEWILVGPRLNIIADHEGVVEHRNVWKTSHSLKLDVKLAWTDEVAAGLPKTVPGWPALLGEARLAMNDALAALKAVEGGEPSAVLAKLGLASAQPIALATTYSARTVAAIEGGAPAEITMRRPDAFAGTLLPKEDVPGSGLDLPGVGETAHHPPVISLSFPQFSHPSTGTPATFLARLLPDPDIFDGTTPSDVLFSVALHQKPASQGTVEAPLCTIGGLGFGKVSLDGGTPRSGSSYSYLRFRAPARPGDAPQFEFQTVFTVGLVRPLAVDRPRGARREAPATLMLDETAERVLDETAERESRYRLIAREELGSIKDRRLFVTLSESDEDTTRSGSFILFSEAPFGLKRSIAEPLSARGDAETIEVAQYDSDTRQWLTRPVSRAYRYTLPPQSIGESMDKPRRLELHDLPATAGLTTEGLERHVTVAFRLTPPAALWVRPSDVERRFTLPEWAAGEIFRQRGELGLGAALQGLRAEFVYGLPVGVDPSRETGASRGARVAEVEALVGRPISYDDDDWRRLLRAYDTRPERLEIWANDPAAPTMFAPARFSTGARFVLRHTALHRHPIADRRQADEKLLPEVETGGPLQPRFHLHGLPGGALWPIESRNVLTMIARAPVASGGSLERVALTPLGGDADQTARFANNRAAIISETRGGYVQRLKVEVIGRIAVLWHRAKHVIVYERTVNPSAQFAPLDMVDFRTRTRRPVQRKVAEYIEILEVERRFPDLAAAPASSNAILAAVRFNSRIIPVDSGWGEDVGTVGFTVPLWNRYAARQRPQVYRRPDIAFVTHAEGATERPEVAQECLNPENLYFFADTTDGLTDDTNAWPSRQGIDATQLPPPRDDWKTKILDKDAPARAAGSVRDSAGRVPPGFARFTWQLAPAATRTAINAGRADKPVYAALESLTFARGVGQETGPSLDNLKKAAGFTPALPVDGVFRGVWTKAGAPIGGADGACLPALAAALRDVVDHLPDELPDDLPANPDPLKAALGDLRLKLASGPGSPLATLGQQLVDAGAQASQTLNFLNGDPCEKLRADFVTGINARKLMLGNELRAWEAEVLRRLDAAGEPSEAIIGAFGSDGAIAAYLKVELAELIRPALRGATNEVGRLQRSVETARATIAEVRAEAEASVTLLKADLRAVRRAVEDAKPWSETRVARLEEQFSTECGKASQRLTAIVTDAQRRLTSELDATAQKIAGAGAQGLAMVAAAAGDVAAGRPTFEKWLDRLEGFATAYADYRLQAEERLEKAAAALEEARGKPAYEAFVGKANALLAAVRGLVEQDGSQDLAALVRRLRRFDLDFASGVASLEARVGHFIRTAGEDVEGVLAELATVVDESGDGLQQRLERLFGAFDAKIAAAVADLAKSAAREFEAPWRWADSWLARETAAADAWLAVITCRISDTAGLMDGAATALLGTFQKATDALEPDKLAGTIVEALLANDPVSKAITRAAAEMQAAGAELGQKRAAAKSSVTTLASELVGQLDGIGEAVLGRIGAITTLCGEISDTADKLLADAKKALDGAITGLANSIPVDLDTTFATVESYKAFWKKFTDAGDVLRTVGNDVAQAVHRLEAWGDRAVDAIAELGKGGPSSAPNNVLKALAAIGSGPELPNLDFAAERIGYYYGLLDSVVDTTPVEAWFGRLGDGLKAMGISLPFSRIGDRLLPDDLQGFDVGRVFRGFAGLDLSRFFGSVKLPQGAQDAIKITHDFDRKAFRAWVQIDIAVDLPGRNPMFSIGPFTLDAMNAKLRGSLRLEASKDTEAVEQTGEARLVTDLDAVVAGQSMVTLRELEIRYGKSGGLDVDFDPKKLKLNPSFEFIQNTLQSVFGDEFGGFEIIKNAGIPVGLRHSFAMPPLSLTFGTSGVQNIQISNLFELTAFPDFVIANRFALARPEMPFIFTIFIIGGTGWLTVDVEYRPFEKAGNLMVVVEAAAGGAASLAFAFAGVTGSVFITVSVALTYRKLIGEPGGGLTVSLVVVITGLVDVLRIVSALITVMLRLSYRDNGDIDALGSFRVTIQISRFFKVSAGGQARYRMSGGKSQTTTSSSAGYEVTDKNLKKAEKLLNKKGG